MLQMMILPPLVPVNLFVGFRRLCLRKPCVEHVLNPPSVRRVELVDKDRNVHRFCLAHDLAERMDIGPKWMGDTPACVRIRLRAEQLIYDGQ